MNEQKKKSPDNPLAFLLQNNLIKVTPGNNGKICIAFKPDIDCACNDCRYFNYCLDYPDPITQQ